PDYREGSLHLTPSAFARFKLSAAIDADEKAVGKTPLDQEQVRRGLRLKADLLKIVSQRIHNPPKPAHCNIGAPAAQDPLRFGIDCGSSIRRVMVVFPPGTVAKNPSLGSVPCTPDPQLPQEVECGPLSRKPPLIHLDFSTNTNAPWALPDLSVG